MLPSNRLSKFEVNFYFISWIFGIFYSVYHVYIIGNKFLYLFEHNLTNGWSLLHRKKDNCDDEWRIWVNFITYRLSVWVIIHHIGARIIHHVYLKALPLWYFAITTIFLVLFYGPSVFVIFLLQPIIFTVFLCALRSHILLWIVCYIASYLFMHELLVPYYGSSYEELQLLSPTLMWIYLRCISFCMFSMNEELNKTLIISFFGYVFYLPCFFLGPIILYDEFYEKLNFISKKYAFKSFWWIIVQNLRYLGWLYFTEFLLHYIYINCLQPYIQLLIYAKNENVWIMYGIGFAMGQFFFLKYTVVFGLGLTWAKSEGYRTPDPPKCIARIYLYSEMWRNFDQGLYFFIKKYIFEPCMNLTNSRSVFKKIWVSFLCFVFIYVWHGLHYSVFMWSALNYCGIVIETIAKSISRTEFYYKFKNILGYKIERRFLAFICAPLTIVSAISNFYFIGGSDVAETYFSFFFTHGTVFSSLCLWYFVYALCHVSMELDLNQKRKKWNPIDRI